jgi:hypothetical protein
MVGTVLVVVSAVLAWSVCALYHLSARWWTTEVGWHVMTFTAVLALVLSLWAVGAIVETKGLWWQVARLVAFTGVPLGLGQRLWILYRLQVRPRRKKTI